MFDWLKKKEYFYHAMTKKQFDSYVKGNVIGFIWEPGGRRGLTDDERKELQETHKQLLFSLPGAFVEAIPCVCLYYDYVDDHSVFHMYFQQPVKAELVIGQGFREDALIYRTKENEHLITSAKIQIELNKKDVGNKGGIGQI
jgi:hypothetical protein